MSPTASVRSIANGFIITSQNQPAEIPTSLYAASLEEVVFWVGKIFEPPTPEAEADRPR